MTDTQQLEAVTIQPDESETGEAFPALMQFADTQLRETGASRLDAAGGCAILILEAAATLSIYFRKDPNLGIAMGAVFLIIDAVVAGIAASDNQNQQI